MTPNEVLGSTVSYSGEAMSSRWEGRIVANAETFKRFIREVVRPRVSDAASSFESDLRGLATTGMATEFVEQVLHALPVPASWEVGEALAECALAQAWDRDVHWPWNSVRDRRTPRASLPGADLVGFCREGDSVYLLFGEVKTSSDANTPPNVMYGDSGMAWQLEQSATRIDIQHTLLKWLYSRCKSEQFLEMYKAAVARYLGSGGKDLLLVGVLMRDTTPSELDLKSRGQAMSERLEAPTRTQLIAWYLPVAIADWPGLLQEEAA